MENMKSSAHLLTIVILAGLVLGTGLPAVADTVVVDQVGLTFVPADITVAPGDTIEWHWSSGTHTVTSGDNAACVHDGTYFDMNLDSSNPVVQYVVPNDGTTFIPYFCRPHCGAGMVGTITILPSPIPAVSQWGMIVMGLLVLVAGTVVFGLHRRAVRSTG
jgi:plastocyanin